jgi:hypothetical protein
MSINTAIGSLFMKMYFGSFARFSRHFFVLVRKSVTDIH